MKFEELKKAISDDLRLSIEGSKGLAVYAKKSSKFENWLQVEAAGVLSKSINKKPVVPEAVLNVNGKEIDVDLLVGDEWAIELKVIGEEEKKNYQETVRAIKEDIEKLKELKAITQGKKINTAMACVIFPVEKEKAYIHENIMAEVLQTNEASVVEDRQFFYFHDNSLLGAIYAKEV